MPRRCAEARPPCGRVDFSLRLRGNSAAKLFRAHPRHLELAGANIHGASSKRKGDARTRPLASPDRGGRAGRGAARAPLITRRATRARSACSAARDPARTPPCDARPSRRAIGTSLEILKARGATMAARFGTRAADGSPTRTTASGRVAEIPRSAGRRHLRHRAAQALALRKVVAAPAAREGRG
jgi:hypothetical protein